MSTETGDKAVVKAMMASGKTMLAEAAGEEEQLELLAPLTADDIDEARAALGPGAGKVAVLREARKRKGRPKGSTNRRTEDFKRYLLRFGQHPAITLMQLQATPPEELVAQSELLDPGKRRMSLHDAQSLRIRCAEALLPYLESKQPVAVDATIRGVIVVEEIGTGHAGPGVIIDGEPLGTMALGDDA